MRLGFSSALHRRRNVLRRELASAMRDGVIDAEERAHIAAHAAALNIPEEEVADILSEKLARRRASRGVCPHCGKSLGERPQRPAA